MNCALTQTWTERPSQVGRRPNLLRCYRDKGRQTLSAIRFFARQPGPAVAGECPIGLGKSVGRSNSSIFQTTTLAISCLVERCQNVAGKLARGLEDGSHELCVNIFVSGQFA